MAHKSTPLPHLLIRASAGSGKTYQLSNRYLSLVASDVALDSILATTFTRKAAGEIQDRVIMRLAAATTSTKALSDLRDQLAVASLSRPRCLALVTQMAQQLHRLRIGTLDSFFIQVAQGLVLELGLPAGWRIVDDIEDTRIRSQAIAAVLAREDHADLARLMQLLTKGEAQRSIAELIRDTVSNLYDVFLEAPTEAWENIPVATPLDAASVNAAIRELVNTPLPNHAKARGSHEKDVDNARRGDWATFMQEGLASHIASGKTEYSRKPIPPETIALYQRLLRHGITALLYQVKAQTIATRDLLARFHEQYLRLKHESRGLRFEDVTRRVGDYMASSGQDKRVAERRLNQLAFRLDGRIQHLLLDEFQDTSLTQWNVLRPMAVDVTRTHGDRSFFCVGDSKQAIYGWRGGVAEIFDALMNQLPDIEPRELDTSYRSSPVIIDVVNQVFRELHRHGNLGRSEAAVARWCQRFPVHKTAKTDYPGHVTLETGPGAEDEEPFVAWVARRIEELVRQAPGASVGVLVKTNATVAELIFALRQRHIPASEEGGNPLTDSAAVQLVLSCIDLADHPGNRVARFHLLESAWAAHLALPALDDDSAWSRWAAATRSQLLSVGYGPTIAAWVDQLGPLCDPREWRRLSQLVTLAYRYDPLATLRPSDFVTTVSARRVADPSTASVTVTTIHKSKGLQYDIVVLPELDKRIMRQNDSFVVGRDDAISPINRVCRYVPVGLRNELPDSLRDLFDADDDQSTTEALCVLYVALTRPVHALHLLIDVPSAKEKALPQTFAGLLRAGLVTDAGTPAPHSVLFELGDADWYAKHEAAQKKKRSGRPRTPTEGETPLPSGAVSPVDAVTAELRQVTLAPTTGARRRGLPTMSPSALAGQRTTRLLEDGATGDVLGRERGTVMHAWFEQVRWVETSIPDDATLDACAARALDNPLPAELQEAMRREFRELLHDQPLAEVWSQTAYEKSLTRSAWTSELRQLLAAGPCEMDVRTEHRFAVRRGDRLLSGVIDRLILLRRGTRIIAADILDYKTDVARTPEEVRTKVTTYRPQLLAYRDAVAQILGLPEAQVRARLLFIGPRRLETL